MNRYDIIWPFIAFKSYIPLKYASIYKIKCKIKNPPSWTILLSDSAILLIFQIKKYTNARDIAYL